MDKDEVAVKAVCVVLALLMIVPASLLSGCGTIFWGTTDSRNRGDLNAGALILDLLALPLLGVIPLIIDIATGGLWYRKGYH